MKVVKNIAVYLGVLFVLLLTSVVVSAQRQVAITIDDPTTKPSAGKGWREKNAALLKTLERHKIKAALFVCGMRVDNEAGRELLATWDKAGHLMANHSYSHLYYNRESLSATQFTADFKKGDSIISSFSHYTRLFRFPYLKEGNTSEKIDSMRQALAHAGYHNGHVSIDASDWYIDAEMIKALEADPKTDLRPYRDYYVRHILDRAAYYDSLSLKVYKKPVKHTLLIHHSLLNALFLEDVLIALKGQGWRLIDAGQAFADPLYGMQPRIVPAGESIIWQLAKLDGRWAGGLRYPGEDGAYEQASLAAWLRSN